MQQLNFSCSTKKSYSPESSAQEGNPAPPAPGPYTNYPISSAVALESPMRTQGPSTRDAVNGAYFLISHFHTYTDAGRITYSFPGPSVNPFLAWKILRLFTY